MRRTSEINKSGTMLKLSERRAADRGNPRQARAHSEPDGTELLTEEHARIRGLFAQFHKAQDDWKGALFEAIKSELHAHKKLEETIFYPALSDSGSQRAKEDVQQSLNDHELIDEILRELDPLTPIDRYFGIKMTELIEEVMSQVRFEQEEIIKVARTELGEEKLKEVGARMKRFKESEGPGSNSQQQNG
jgi:hypothetical protein